jgi:hypothetical protein
VRIVAPLRVEALAVGGTRIGLRARRLPPGDRLVLAGVAGAVVPGLAPGDIVVADRVLLSPTLPPEPPGPTDPTDPADPADPADPLDPADRADPADPDDPLDPTDRADQVDRADRADPADPVDTADQVDPADRADPAGPVDTADPVDPADRADQVDPADPVRSGDPTRSGDPARSGEPARSGDPTRSGEPARSGDPTRSGEPARSREPARSGPATGGGEVMLPGAAELAKALRIAGLTVHLGPVGGADELVTGPARTAWAERGAIAVDMESGVVARTGRLGAVVRAIVDTPAHPLVSLGTLPRGSRALRALRRAAPILSAWAAGQGDADVRERQAAHVVDITITMPREVENS